MLTAAVAGAQARKGGSSGKKKPAFALPAEMVPAVRVEYEKMCEKGRVLYEMNCAGCHNVKRGRLSLVPDFTQDQITGYSIRTGNATHVRTLSDEAITAEELALIATYLQYKTPSGAQVADAFGGKLNADEEH